MAWGALLCCAGADVLPEAMAHAAFGHVAAAQHGLSGVSRLCVAWQLTRAGLAGLHCCSLLSWGGGVLLLLTLGCCEQRGVAAPLHHAAHGDLSRSCQALLCIACTVVVCSPPRTAAVTVLCCGEYLAPSWLARLLAGCIVSAISAYNLYQIVGTGAWPSSCGSQKPSGTL